MELSPTSCSIVCDGGSESSYNIGGLSDSDVDEAGPHNGSEGSDGSNGMDLADFESEASEGTLGGTCLRSSRVGCGGGGWQPGVNCGVYLSHRDHLPVIQAQVLITNVYLNLKRLPPAVAKALWLSLNPGVVCIKRNFADRLASKLMGVSQSRARTLHNHLRDRGWIPAGTHAGGSAAPPLQEEGLPLAGAVARADGVSSREARALEGLKVRVREAMAVACGGLPDVAYSKSMERLQLHGVKLGTKYLSFHFVQLAELFIATAAQIRTADVLSRPLPSLGIASDLTLVFDGVSIGTHSFSRNETLYLIGFIVQTQGASGVRGVSARSLRIAPLELQAKLIAAPSCSSKAWRARAGTIVVRKFTCAPGPIRQNGAEGQTCRHRM